MHNRSHQKWVIIGLGVVAFISALFFVQKHHHGQWIPSRSGENTAQAPQRGEQKTANLTPGAKAPDGSIIPGSQEMGKPTVQEVAPNCYLATYRHKQIASHSDEEACSHHKNILKVSHEKFSTASVCVRVNNRPVKFERVKGKSDELLIGAIAGPQSKITVRYCIAKATCNDDCKIPRDEFMDAIGGGDEEEAPKGAQAKWDPSDSNEGLNAQVDDVQRDLASVGGEESGTYVFKDWLLDDEKGTCEQLSQK